jgi:hypothetical protein
MHEGPPPQSTGAGDVLAVVEVTTLDVTVTVGPRLEAPALVPDAEREAVVVVLVLAPGSASMRPPHAATANAAKSKAKAAFITPWRDW